MTLEHTITADGYLEVDGITVGLLTAAGREHSSDLVRLYLETMDGDYVGEYPWGGYRTTWNKQTAIERGWLEE